MAGMGPDALFSATAAFATFTQAISVSLLMVSMALSQYIVVLAGVSTLSMMYVAIIGMSFLAMSYAVAALAMSLNLLPEKKMIAIGVASGRYYKSMMDSAVKLTPEAVAHTKEIVTAADYVKVQAEMLSRCRCFCSGFERCFRWRRKWRRTRYRLSSER